MITRFFKFPDIETAFSLAKQHGLTTINENNEEILIRFSHTHSIDVVGTLYTPTGIMLTSDDGMLYPEMQEVDGWHINVRTEQNIPDEFLPYEIFPSSPSRDFA